MSIDDIETDSLIEEYLEKFNLVLNSNWDQKEKDLRCWWITNLTDRNISKPHERVNILLKKYKEYLGNGLNVAYLDNILNQSFNDLLNPRFRDQCKNFKKLLKKLGEVVCLADSFNEGATKISNLNFDITKSVFWLSVEPITNLRKVYEEFDSRYRLMESTLNSANGKTISSPGPKKTTKSGNREIAQWVHAFLKDSDTKLTNKLIYELSDVLYGAGFISKHSTTAAGDLVYRKNKRIFNISRSKQSLSNKRR